MMIASSPLDQPGRTCGIRLLREAYALLPPINFAEPFGLSVVEAMACGTRVIAIACDAMPEIIANQQFEVILTLI